MRVRLNVVLTGALVAIALGAPFALPRLLDSQGSAGVALRALAAPLIARNTVVEMPAQPARRHAARVRATVVRATPHVAVSHASLASVHTGVEAASVVRTAVVQRWFRQHRQAPVESRRVPAPAPAPPSAVAAPVPLQPANLNSTDSSAPAPAAVALPDPAAPSSDGNSGDDSKHGHDNGNGHGNGDGHGNGHGNGHDH